MFKRLLTKVLHTSSEHCSAGLT